MPRKKNPKNSRGDNKKSGRPTTRGGNPRRNSQKKINGLNYEESDTVYSIINTCVANNIAPEQAHQLIIGKNITLVSSTVKRLYKQACMANGIL
jgi:hypothetical protein